MDSGVNSADSVVSFLISGGLQKVLSKLVFTCSKSIIETLEKDVNFEQINVSWADPMDEKVTTIEYNTS